MITTYDPSVVKYWAEQGMTPSKTLNFDGVPYWQISVPEDDERLKDPSYIQLLLQGKLFLYPAVVQKRMRLPLYTMTRGGFWIETKIGNEKDIRAIPLSRSRSLLQYAYVGIGVNNDLKVKQFITKKRLLKTLSQALQEEIEYIALIGDKEHIEKVEIKVAMVALNAKPHPGMKLMQGGSP